MDWKELISVTVAAVQGSIAVLLIMVYGYGARSFGLLSLTGERNLSAIVTNLCLPALLFTGIGPSATADLIVKYWIIIAYSVITQLIMYIYALLCLKFRIFKTPLWTGACMFNNVIALPLLMLDSLTASGALDNIARPRTDLAIQKAKTYLLIYALSSHMTSFLFGPQLMSTNGYSSSSPSRPQIDEATGGEQNPGSVNEGTPLLSGTHSAVRSSFHIFQSKVKKYMNPPLFGGLMAIVVGVVPFLHSMFFQRGGFLRGGFTHSVDEMGKLYVAVQLLTVGSRLFSSSQQGRGDGGHVPKRSMLALMILRFFLMPLVTIPLIYGVRRWWPSILPEDPMFDFVLMIVPVGPPAIHLAAVAELADVPESEKGALSRVLMLSYAFTPIISLSIAASLFVVEKEGIAHNYW